MYLQALIMPTDRTPLARFRNCNKSTRNASLPWCFWGLGFRVQGLGCRELAGEEFASCLERTSFDQAPSQGKFQTPKQHRNEPLGKLRTLGVVAGSFLRSHVVSKLFSNGTLVDEGKATQSGSHLTAKRHVSSQTSNQHAFFVSQELGM